MGRQFMFYMDSQLEEEFKDYVLFSGGIFLFEGNKNQPVQVSEFLSTAEPWWFKLLIYRKEYGDILMKETDSGRKYVDRLASPIIEFNRTTIRENKAEIQWGRLYYVSKYYNYDNSGAIVVKDARLEEWYNELTKWLRKRMTRQEIADSNGFGFKMWMTEPIRKLVENDGYRLI